MKVCNYLDVEPREPLPGATLREVITGADGAPTFRMRVIEVQPGKSSHSHSHDFEHEVFVVSGHGVVTGEQGEKAISTGTVVFVPPGEHHCFINTGRATLRFICCVPLNA